MKQVIRRLTFSVILILSLCRVGKAQFIVSDPTNFAGNALNLLKELGAAAEELGVAQENFKFITDTYEKISPFVETYYKLEYVYRLVDDYQRYSLQSVNRIINDPYLKPHEVVRILRLNTAYTKYTTKTLKELALSLKRKGGTSTDRVALIDTTEENFQAGIAALKIEVKKLENLSYSRRQAEATELYMKMLRGY